MVADANTPNGRTPHIGGGIALLPLGENGEKQGVDDLLAKGWTWNDVQAFVYPMDEVFNMKTGEFAPKKWLSSFSSPVRGDDDNHFGDDLPIKTVAEYLATAPQSYDWVAEGFAARGAITKLAGAAKYSGKTTLLMDMVSNVLAGTPFLGRPTKQARVLYLTEQANNIKEALEDAGLDERTEGLFLLFSHDVYDVGWDDLMRRVTSACKAKDIDLVIVDTLVEFGDIEGDDENSSGKTKATLRPLKQMAQTHNLGVVFTQHHNTRGRGRGSTQFEGDVDILLDLYRLSGNNDGPDEEETDPNVRLLKGIGRGRDTHHELYIKLTEDGYETLNVSEGPRRVGKKAKIVLRFLPVLEADARTINELMEALEGAGKDISEATLRRALGELEGQGLACKKGVGTKNDPARYWRQEPKRNGDQETEDTNSFSSSRHTGDENDDNHFSSLKVVPIRPDVEVKGGDKKNKKKAEASTPEELAERFNYVHTEGRLKECREWAARCAYVSVDVETKGKNKEETLLYTKATIRLISLHYGEESWFLDCDYLDDGGVTVLLKQLEDKPKYFHNSAFDVPRIHRRFGVLLNKNVRDTLVASRTARAGEWEEVRDGNKVKRSKKDHDLRECLKRELGIEIPKTKQKWSGPLTEEHLLYAADDVAHLKELYDALYERIEGLGIKTAYDAIAATLHMFLESAALGVPVDAGMLEAIQTEADKEKGELESRLKELAPEHPEGLKWKWRNSDKDTRPEGKGRAGVHRMLQSVGVKLPNLEEQTLLDNREKHPLVKALYEYRKVAAAHSKYRRILEDFYEDGRIYPQVKVAGAVTSRVLYSEPNIQGFDKKKTDRYRKCVRAEEGYYVVKGDFAQQELRIAAYSSEDEALMTAFANDEDVYMRVAEKIAGKPVKRGTKEGDKARAAAKRAVLGYLYGLGPEKYRKNVYKDTGVEISLEEAKSDREAFRSAYPGFYKWQKSYGSHKDETNLPKKDMWETRSVRGWRRVVEGNYERKSEWKKEHGVAAAWVPKYTERLNGPIQSTAGDILYLTLSKLDADLSSGVYPGTRFLFTAHDEVVLTCPEGAARDVATWLKFRMVEALEEVLGPELGGPRSVEVGGGPSWGEIEEWS